MTSRYHFYLPAKLKKAVELQAQLLSERTGRSVSMSEVVVHALRTWLDDPVWPDETQPENHALERLRAAIDKASARNSED